MAEYYYQEMNDVHGDGVRRGYYRMRTYHQISTEDLLDFMERNGAHVNRGTSLLVLEELRAALVHFLAFGHSVHIDQLGSMRVSLGVAEDKEVEGAEEDAGHRNARSVEVRSVTFRPDKGLCQEITQAARLERGRTRRPKPSPYTLEERIEKARHFITEKGMMRITDYAVLTGLSRPSASREINLLLRDASNGFTTLGRGSHRVIVLRRDEATE
ncbi:MAG: DNA-binding protein [Prevotellaceae bacterium]|nr:DNA-binding protein [Prevotellaceae bacterium]